MAPASAAEPEPGVVAGEVTAPSSKLRAGVVVYLEKVPGPFRPPAEPAVIDQAGMKFVPRVLPVLRGTTVAFRNSDPVRHNVFTPDAEKYNLGTWPTGESRSHTFAKSGVYRQLCNVHPEMEAFVVVLDNPHYVMTDEQGRFTLRGVPPGSYTLKTWSEKLQPGSAAVTVVAGQQAAAKIALVRP
ncbi:MAG: carboxypeptidase regulatory-like domain-containing protein [Deltaproteobacteria bacterium]|nr:carboxypeptidase regulatory-like domain-containing protein [Deltaproteobacteria bacterium]